MGASGGDCRAWRPRPVARSGVVALTGVAAPGCRTGGAAGDPAVGPRVCPGTARGTIQIGVVATSTTADSTPRGRGRVRAGGAVAGPAGGAAAGPAGGAAAGRGATGGAGVAIRPDGWWRA